MKKLIWILPVLGIILLNSCSETTTPSSTVDYLPKSLGSYWIYENYTLDSVNNRVNATSAVIDSTLVTGTEVKLNQTASIFQHYTNTNNAGYVEGNKWHFYTQNENVFVFSGLFNQLLGISNFPVKLPFTIDDKWMQLYDAANSTWVLHSKTFTNDTIVYGTNSYPFSGSFTITANKKSKEEISIGSKKLSCQKIDYVFAVNGSIKYLVLNIPVTLSGTCSMWFSDKIGLVKINFPSQKLEVTGIMSQYLPGTEQNLLRYNIK